MRNLTFYNVIDNTYIGLQKYMKKSSIQGDNVFFYIPSTLMSINGGGFAMVGYKNSDKIEPIPLDIYSVDPTAKDGSKITGTVSIDFKVFDSDHNIISFVYYKDIPLVSPYYNKAYFVPKVTWQHGRYFGFASKFPHLEQDATIEITEHWKLQIEGLSYPFAYQRELKIPVHPDSSVKAYDPDIGSKIYSIGEHSARYTKAYNKDWVYDYGTYLTSIFGPIRTYNFNHSKVDYSYHKFGNQSIFFGNYLYTEALIVPQDPEQPQQLQLMNSQPEIVGGSSDLTGRYGDPRVPVEPEKQQKQTVDALKSKLDLEGWTAMLYQTNNYDWLKARFNLFNLEGKQFIHVYDDHNHEKLEFKFPTFSVTK